MEFPLITSSPPFPFFILCVGLDLLFGDPVYSFHPIRLTGNLLSYTENVLRPVRLGKISFDGRIGGIVFVMIALFIVLGVVQGIFFILSQGHWVLGWIWYLYIAYSMLALKDLMKHGKQVASATEAENLEGARSSVQMMVGRDTNNLDIKGCNRAAIESLSENLSDGVIAPLFFLLLFGVPGMVFFKVVSTMDSMVGYRTEKYINFGWCAARLDDVLNFIPARVVWLLICVSAFFVAGCSSRKAFWVGLQQHSILSSPNAGWSEGAAAGGLQTKLVGPILRKGHPDKTDWIGFDNDPVGAISSDIQKMLNISVVSTLLFTIIIVVFKVFI